MPRTRLGEIYKPKFSKTRANYLHQFLKDAYRARGWTSKTLGEAVGENESTVRGRINSRPEEWKIGDLYRYADALDIDHVELFDVILLSDSKRGKQ